LQVHGLSITHFRENGENLILEKKEIVEYGQSYMSMGSQLKDFWVCTYFRNALLLGHPYLILLLRVLGKKGEGAPPNDTTLCRHLMLCLSCEGKIILK
jgi:hypothetical protein